jgi:putative toxin-antitoxin system antitoxin component (TIGR02293 family)
MPPQGAMAEATDRETVICRAIEVIGDEKEAMRWLGTPVPALGYSTPISLLINPEGQTAVLNVLTQLEHGVL